MPKQIQIVGAGLSGLTAAVILAREGHNVTVIEAQKGIGGPASLHPSVHGTPVQLNELIAYTGIDFTPSFRKTPNYPRFFNKTRLITMPPYTKYNDAYCVERGPRPTSVDNYLAKLAREAGVKFEFGQRVDIKKLAPGTIVATGLSIKEYEDLGIPAERLYGWWSYKEIPEKTDDVLSIMGPFATDYGYIGITNGLDYNLLFSHRPITQKDKDSYLKVLSKLGFVGYLEPWRDESMCIPSEAKLIVNDLILAGTLGGMIEPFWGYGIVGAIVSGRVAAKAAINRAEGLKDYEGFTRGFAAKSARHRKLVAYPHLVRSALIQGGIAWIRLQCVFNKKLATSPRDPVKWFRVKK
jgi:flavin-dependent dehydrogenase